VGLRVGLDALERTKSLFRLPDIKSRFLGRPNGSLVTVPTVLCRCPNRVRLSANYEAFRVTF
jgi:hypothetical protein